MFSLFKKSNIGIDIVEVERFSKYQYNKIDPFLEKVFSRQELDYCFTFNDPAPHLAGLFSAKEATSKALGVNKYPFIEIEIRHEKDGAPCVYNQGKKLSVRISITHTKICACAVAIT